MRLAYYIKIPMRYKFAEAADMGDARLSQLQSATGDDGRVRPLSAGAPRTQANSAFDEMSRQMRIDSNDESNQFSVGSDQSKVAVHFQAMKTHSHVPVRFDRRAKDYGGGFYHPSEDWIGIDKNEDADVLAHELGHAQFQKSLLGKITQSAPARLMHLASPLAGLAIGATVTGSAPARILKSLLVGLGLSAPTLISEGVATYNGYQSLKHLGADQARLDQYKKRIIPPQSTYLLNPLMASGASLLSSSMKNAAARALDRRTTFRDFNISIETDAGRYRNWYDKSAKREGKTLMQYPYGYIRGTKGMDGEHIDCFVGPDESAANVYVITTNKAPDFKTIDEQKCMLGFSSAGEAKRVFLEHYSNSGFFNSILTIPYSDFKTRVYRTLHSRVHKIGSTANFDGIHDWSRNAGGPHHGQVPGDYLGFPASSLVGLRQINDTAMTPSDRIDKMFRFNDQEMNTRVLEGNSGAAPSDPGV